jgi:hypothetical protein
MSRYDTSHFTGAADVLPWTSSWGREAMDERPARICDGRRTSLCCGGPEAGGEIERLDLQVAGGEIGRWNGEDLLRWQLVEDTEEERRGAAGAEEELRRRNWWRRPPSPVCRTGRNGAVGRLFPPFSCN